MLDQFIQRSEVLFGIGESEVIAHHNKEVTLLCVVKSLVIQPVTECGHTLINIVSSKCRVIYDGLIVAQSIEIEALWRTVVHVESMREYLSPLPTVLEEGSPDPLHLLTIESPLLVLVVQSRKEPSIEAHLCEEPRCSTGMTEGVNVPGDTGSHSELLHQEIMPSLHIIDKVVVVGGGLIGHGPACVEEFETPIFDKLADVILHGFRLLVEPHGEELHLHVGETPGRILQQLSNCSL